MIYDINLTLDYLYSGKASAGRHLVCVMPRDIDATQRLIAGLVEIAPETAQRHDRHDFFGNAVADFALTEPHEAITVKLQARVERLDPIDPRQAALPLSSLPRALQACRDLGPESPLHYTAASPHVPISPDIAAFARDCITDDIDARAAVHAVGRALFEHMTFDSKATTVDTPIAEAFAARRGVCQDFSQIMIAALRSLGCPAGYVSGYLRTRPPPGKKRLEGADAMHAWVRAWCGPDVGWCTFDPTNDTAASLAHIVVAHGRDYADVAPIRGVLRVSGGQRSRQAVDVIAVGET